MPSRRKSKSDETQKLRQCRKGTLDKSNSEKRTIKKIGRGKSNRDSDSSLPTRKRKSIGKKAVTNESQSEEDPNDDNGHQIVKQKGTKRTKLKDTQEAEQKNSKNTRNTSNSRSEKSKIKSQNRKTSGNKRGLKSDDRQTKQKSVTRTADHDNSEPDLVDADEIIAQGKAKKADSDTNLRKDKVHSFEEGSDSSVSDFEEVEPDQNAAASLKLEPQGLPHASNLGDSDTSDFEDVVESSQSGKGNKQKKLQKKETVKRNGKNKKARKSRKRQSLETVPHDDKKLKMDVNETNNTMSSNLDGIDVDDVTAVLLRMEGCTQQQQASTSQGQGQSSAGGISSLSDASDDDSDEEEDWEEVEDHKGSPWKSRIPKEPVEITLEAPDIMGKKRKKKKFDWQKYIQQKMRRFQKDVQINMHKAHLLCLLAQGFRQNAVCSSDVLQAQVMSLMPICPKVKVTSGSTDTLKLLLKWFHNEFSRQTTSAYFTQDKANGVIEATDIETAISTRMVHDGRTLVLIFIILLRVMGFDVRLIISFHPLGFKLAEKEKFTVKKNSEVEKIKAASSDKPTSEGKFKNVSKSPLKESQKKLNTKSKGKTAQKKKTNTSEKLTPTDTACERTDAMKKVKSEKPAEKCRTSKQRVVLKEDIECSDSEEDSLGVVGKEMGRVSGKGKQPLKQKSSKGKQLLKKRENDNSTNRKGKKSSGKGGKQKVKKGLSEEGLSVNDDSDDTEPSRTLRRRRNTKSMQEEVEEEDGSESGFEEFVPSDSESNFSEEDDGVKKKQRKNQTSSVKSEKEENKTDIIDVSSGSEFMEEDKTFRSPLKRKLKKNNKVLSSDSESDDASGRGVECEHSLVDKPYEIESVMSPPLQYVLAYSTDGHVRDVTARYASDWLSKTRKLRPDREWWMETLEEYRDQHAEKDEEDMKEQLMKRPMPTNIGDFKNHPLYALSRHLLKFEALYPETAVPLGYIRSEPIYARECVHTLHSRENWLKEGRAVKLGEDAYKMVKSRKKWKKPKENPDALDLEIFGEWQTEKYIPPPAVDGKIPRNEYGNIELFQPWMIPGGTVHLQGFPALNRVAKKLNLDCVPAMVGWENHSFFSHPLIDGWVVCEEHKDILIAAWDEDQEIQKQREIEKREKRVLANWKLLTRSLLIKERLKKKFDLREAEDEHEVETGDGKKATDVDHAWPSNRLESKKKNKRLPKYMETM